MSTTQISVKRAQGKWDELRDRMGGSYWADKLWNEDLSPTDQRRLGENLDEVLKEFGAVRMLMKLRGYSPTYAVLHLANLFELISDREFKKLAGELGEFPRDLDEHARWSHAPAADPVADPEKYFDECVEAGHLVLRDDGERMLYWRAMPLEIKLLKSERLWEIFIELAKKSKSGTGLCAMDLQARTADQAPDQTQDDEFEHLRHTLDKYIRKAVSKIRCEMELPQSLVKLLVPGKKYEQKINWPPERIHIFEADGRRELREWMP